MIKNEFEANQLIDNVLSEMRELSDSFSYITKKGRVYETDVFDYVNDMIDSYISQYGAIAVASALEQAKETKNLKDARLYIYEVSGSNKERQEEIKEYFSDGNGFEEDIREALESIQDEEEDWLSNEELQEYRRNRKNLQSKIYRARRKGYNVPSLERISGRISRDEIQILKDFEEEWFR